MGKQNKNSNTTKPVADREQSPVPVGFPWKLVLAGGIILLGVFFIHLLVFSDLETLLSTNDRAEFIQRLNVRSVQLAVLIVLVLSLLVIVLRLIRRNWIAWVVSTILWLLVLGYAGELWMNCRPISSGNAEALVSNVWFRKYWSKNYFGFRDRDYNFSAIREKKIILFVGDSFVAGGGLKDPATRMSDVLQRLLGDPYVVINAGVNGIGTRAELNILKSFPLRPWLVVCPHVVNDIEELIPPDRSYINLYRSAESPFSEWLGRNSRNSLFLDLVYQFVKSLQYAGVVQPKETETGNNRPRMLYEWYKDSAILKQHLADLDTVAAFVTGIQKAKYISMLYPEDGKQMIDSSDRYVNQVISRHLEGRPGIYSLSVTPVYLGMRPAARRVNMFDGHPSERVNKILADSLFAMIRRIENERY